MPRPVSDKELRIESPPSHPKFEYIPLSVPCLRGNEWAYVKECLDTNWLSSVGPYVNRFEQMMAEYTNGGHAIATVNGTAALHVALLASGVQPDEEVLVPTLTFIASANAIRYVGAWPVFIDADPVHWQMDPERLTEFTEQHCIWKKSTLINKATRRRIRAILPVHILGHPCNMDPILEVARRYKLTVIEDAAESIGARYRGGMVGSLGDIGCFSFNGNKMITTGGGGMVVTKHAALAERIRYLSTQAKDDPIEYHHREIGYNYRLTNLQAALGCAQMERVEEKISAKRQIASTYERLLCPIQGLTVMKEASSVSSVWWLYTIVIDSQNFGIDSRHLLKRLGQMGIQTRPLWQPLHRSAAHRGLVQYDCPVADRLYRDALSLPSSVGLSEVDQHRVVEAIAMSRMNRAG